MPVVKGKKQINVLMTDQEAEDLKQLADKEERSVSQMAGILIREGMDKRSEQEKQK